MAKSGTTAAAAAKMKSGATATRSTTNSPSKTPARTSAAAQRAGAGIVKPLKGPKQGY